MTDYTRLTVIGSARRAELVVPDDETVGALLPWLADVLEEPAGSGVRPLTLLRAGGHQLEAGLSVADQDVGHGEQVRLVFSDDAPAPPEVADVTDVLADSQGTWRGRWSDGPRVVAGAVGVGALSCATSVIVPGWGLGLVGSAAGLLVIAAMLLGRLGPRWGGIAATAAAAGLTPILAVRLLERAGVPSDRVLTSVLATGAALAWVVLGLGVGVGLRMKPALAAAGVGAVLAAVPVVLAALGMPTERAVAVNAVAAVVVCGLLPWYALSVSGLTGLDDEVLSGRPGRRDVVLRTAAEGYASLTWATFAVALPLAITGGVLAGSAQTWALGLGIAVAVVTGLRTRAFPLAAQQLPLWAAVLFALLMGVASQPRLTPAWSTVLLGAIAFAVVTAVGVRPVEHQRARLRRLGNLVEAVAVIAMIPLLFGVLGVYTDLLGAFRRGQP